MSRLTLECLYQLQNLIANEQLLGNFATHCQNLTQDKVLRQLLADVVFQTKKNLHAYRGLLEAQQ